MGKQIRFDILWGRFHHHFRFQFWQLLTGERRIQRRTTNFFVSEIWFVAGDLDCPFSRSSSDVGGTTAREKYSSFFLPTSPFHACLSPVRPPSVPTARASTASKKLLKVGRPQTSNEYKIQKKRENVEREKKRRQDFKKRNPVGTDFYQTEPKITLKSLDAKRFWFWLIDSKGLQMTTEEALKFDQYRASVPHFSKIQWSVA